MIYFDEHKRMHIVDETGWWEPKMIPQLLSELYGAIAAGTEDGLSYHKSRHLAKIPDYEPIGHK